VTDADSAASSGQRRGPDLDADDPVGGGKCCLSSSQESDGVEVELLRRRLEQSKVIAGIE